jgi:hypothetical protein
VLETTDLPSTTSEIAGFGSDIFLLGSKEVTRVRDGKLKALALRPKYAKAICASRAGLHVVDESGGVLYFQPEGASAFEKVTGNLHYPTFLTVTDDGVYWVEKCTYATGSLACPDVLVRWRPGDKKPEKIYWAKSLAGLGAEGEALYVLFETSDKKDKDVTLLLRLDHDGEHPQVIARGALGSLVVGEGQATMTRGDDIVRVLLD